jgi:Zn-dependent protease with chaperone function/uncharacterized tellurite resistance protein B-like protein
MDFFDREAHAQKQTRRLIWLFGLAVLVVVIAVDLISASVIWAFQNPLFHEARWNPMAFSMSCVFLFGEAVMRPLHFLKMIWNPAHAVWITLGTLTWIALGCLYKFRVLSAGGSVVAELLGGRRIETNTDDPNEQRLRHVVEEMAVASGAPVPEIYLLENERGINSFAAGHTRDDVAIGITRGGLLLLTRDELQGVIAHEFSHILNGDTRFNMKLMALAHGLFWPTILGRMLIYGGSDAPAAGESFLLDDDPAKLLPTAPLGLLFVIIGSISLPFVRLLKSAICRQREWLADAAAVQFTRNPAGISGALKKIGGVAKQARLDTPNAEMASHLYFANFAAESWFRIFSTHPPLAKRIVAIDPAFDGQFPKVQALAPNQYERDQAYEQNVARVISVEQNFLPDAIVSQIGSATAAHIKQTALMRFSLPPEVKAALREPAGATGVVYALLLSDDDEMRARQMELLRSSIAPNLFAQTTALAPQIQALGDKYKLALAEFAVPALRQTGPDESAAFSRTLQQLIESDGTIDLFEFAVMKMVARQWRAGAETNPAHYGRVQDVVPECALLLSALAHVGQENEADAPAAFAKGREFLDAPGAKIEFVPRGEWDLNKVDAALNRLARCPANVQRNVILACGKTVAADGKVTEREAELLRAIADALNCPMPPFVDALRMEALAAKT